MTIRAFNPDSRQYETYESLNFTGPRAEFTLLPADGRAERWDGRFHEAQKYRDEPVAAARRAVRA